MDFNSLPKEIQNEILKLAREHPITIDDAKECYLMGGDHADKLCQLKAIDASDYVIRLQNDVLWAEKNKKIIDELRSL